MILNTEDNSAGEDYFPPLKKFQTCSLQSQYGVFQTIYFNIF